MTDKWLVGQFKGATRALAVAPPKKTSGRYDLSSTRSGSLHRSVTLPARFAQALLFNTDEVYGSKDTSHQDPALCR